MLFILCVLFLLYPFWVRAVTVDSEYYPQGNSTVLVPTRGIVSESGVKSSDNHIKTGDSVDIRRASSSGEVRALQGYKSLVEETFGANSRMVAIAGCESSWRQFEPSGTILMGGGDDNYIGIFQIGKQWVPTAQKMGLDVYTPEGNVLFAQYLLNTYGLSQWSCNSMI